MWMRLHESHGSSTPQNPWSPGTQGVGWPSPKDIEEAVKECVGGDCGKVKELIRMATYASTPLMSIMGGFVVSALWGFGIPMRKIRRVMAVNWYAVRRLLRLDDVFEFSRISEFKPRTVFDAYWMYTSLATLKLPFVVKSRFDPINGNICDAFGDEKLCHMYIAGYLIAEASKGIKKLSLRFKYMDTTHPVTVALLLSIASHFAVGHEIAIKMYIYERWGEVYFIFGDLPKDVRRFAEDVWENPTTLVRLTDNEFLAFLAGLIAGDGYIVWSRGAVDVAIVGNLKREKPLYAVVQDELKRRLGIEASLYEKKNSNVIVLYTQSYDAVRLLHTLPPLIKPLKELRRQLVLRRSVIGVFTARKILELLGRNGIHELQSRQATRFFTVLLRLGLIRLKEVQGHRYHILETPTNPHGWVLRQ